MPGLFVAVLFLTCVSAIRKPGANYARADGVVVSHPFSMQEVPGSIPGLSILLCHRSLLLVVGCASFSLISFAVGSSGLDLEE